MDLLAAMSTAFCSSSAATTPMLGQGNPADPPQVICLHLAMHFTVSYCHLINRALTSLSQKDSSRCAQFLAQCCNCCWKGTPQSAQTSPIKPKLGTQKGLGLSISTSCQAGPGVQFLQADLFHLSCFPWGFWAPPGSFPPVPNPEIKWPSFDLEEKSERR